MASKIQGSIGGTLDVPDLGSKTFNYVFQGGNHSAINEIRLSIFDKPTSGEVTADITIQSEGDGSVIPIPTIPDGETKSDTSVTIPYDTELIIPTLVCPERGDELVIEVENDDNDSDHDVNIVVSQASEPVAGTET